MGRKRAQIRQNLGYFLLHKGRGEPVEFALVIEEKEQTFLHCKCPKCKRAFDFVPISAYECPFCQWEIRRSEVWETRHYPGVLILPGWVKAFGWPLLIMLSGVAFFFYIYFAAHEIELKVPSALIAIGLVFFLFKLHTNGEA